MTDAAAESDVQTVKFFGGGRKNDPLLAVVSALFSFLSEHQPATWLAVLMLVAGTALYFNVWLPYERKRRAMRADAERIALVAERKRHADVTRLAAIAELQAKADAEAADAQARQWHMEREKLLKKLELKGGELAGNVLGTKDEPTFRRPTDSGDGSSSAPKKPKPTASKAVARGTGASLLSGGGSASSSFKPSGSMRKLGGGGGG